MNIFTVEASQILALNKFICEEGKNIHGCNDPGRIEIAIHSAYYPGAPPFAAGAIIQISAILCFYLIKNHIFVDGNKRTAALIALTLLNLHGFELEYPDTGKDNFATIVESCAAGDVDKDDLVELNRMRK